MADLPAAPRRSLPPLFWLLTALLALLLIVGVGSIFYYFRITRATPPPAAAHGSPWDDLAAADILSGLAVWSLAEAEPEELFRQAMAIDAVETAAAETLTTPALSDAQRLGWLKVLARRQATGSGNAVQAASLSQLAADLALLAPSLGDLQRAEALIGVAEVWGELGRGQEARDLLAEATRVAVSGPDLAPAIRRRLLEQIAQAYTGLGDNAAARTARALPADAPAAPPPSLPDPLTHLTGPLAYNDEVTRFQAARIQQAQAYVDAWIARAGQIGRGEAQMLAGALIDEDLARAIFYDQRLRDPALAAGDRAALLWDRIHWLLIKYRAASGLYGAPLVEGWAAEQPAIRQALHDAFLDLTTTLRQLISDLPAEEQAPATHALYRRLLIWARLGLYPDADFAFLANALNDAAQQWPDPPILLPRATTGRAPLRFTFAGP